MALLFYLILCVCFGGRFRFLFFGNYKIKNNGNKENNGNAVFTENGFDDIGEDRKHFGGLCEAETDRKRKCGNGDISLREAAVAEHLKTADNDRTKHHNGTAAEYGFGKGCEYGTDRRKNTCDDHDDRACGNTEAVYDLGHCDKTDILAEGCDGQATKARGK